MSEINAIAISGTQPLDIEHYFAVNFEELNESINKLGDRTQELTNEDKTLAVEIINTWNHDVISTIDKKLREVENFCISFDLTKSDIRLTDEEIGALAQHLGFDREYDIYMSTWQQYLDLVKEHKAINEKYSKVDVSPKNKELLGHYSAELYKNEVETSTARRKADRITTDLFTKMTKTEEIKAFLKKGQQFLSQADDLKKAAVKKANLARVNVTIDNQNVKDALYELMAFSF